MKTKLCIIASFIWFFIYFQFQLFGQSVGINTDGSDPDTRTILDIKSTNKGVLLPRITDSVRNFLGQNIPEGMLIYNTTDKQLQIFVDNKWYPLTMGTPEDAPITDADGNIYTPVVIGSQTWLKENLRTTRYINGDLIGTTTPATLNICGESSPKYQWAYNGNESNVATYGRLYTWYVVSDSRKICPGGWHVPTINEWNILKIYLGMTQAQANDIGDQGTDQGNQLKEAGNEHWLSPSAGTNSSGFTALPGGNQDSNFAGIGTYGIFWSSTDWYTYETWAIRLLNSSSQVNTDPFWDKPRGFSVRCLKDN